MDIEEVDPALRSAVRRIPAGSGSPNVFGRTLARLAMRAMPARRVDGVTVRKVRSGGARVRVHLPSTGPAGAGLLWIHGGGYFMGDAKVDDRHCGQTARQLGIVVVSAEYRLAPEHPFPAAADDVRAAWQWFLDHAAELGVDPARIAVGGQSAGGGLAAGLVQRLHDEGGPQPMAQWLFCPMLDDRTAGRRELDSADHWLWNNVKNRFGWRSYLGVEPGADAVPAYAVPARRQDLSGQPPTWLDVGTIELFRDEVRSYARRLREAGTDVVLEEVDGAPHGFEIWAADSAPAQALLDRARGWLGRQVARTAP